MRIIPYVFNFMFIKTFKKFKHYINLPYIDDDELKYKPSIYILNFNQSLLYENYLNISTNYSY